MSFYDHYTFNCDENRPAGYILEVTTWENDADNYKTVPIYGLELNDVKFLIKFFSHFKSSSRNSVNFGNSDLDPENTAKIMEVFKKTFNECPPSSPDIFADFKEFIDNEWDINECLIYDIIGTWYESQMYRVADNFNVYYVPVEIESKFNELEELLS